MRPLLNGGTLGGQDEPLSASDEHNRLYLEATALLKRDRIVELTPPVSLGWLVRRRVRRAISLLEKVVALSPGNWAALWVMGKSYQALGEHTEALSCFSKSRLLNDQNADVAREAGISAMECDRPELAVQFTRAALKISPGNAGLLANLALAHLFAGEPKAAREVLNASLESDPNDRITRAISKVVDEVIAGKRRCPRRSADILSG